MIRSLDLSGRRRYVYRRAKTLSTLPAEFIPEVENEFEEEGAHLNDSCKLIQQTICSQDITLDPVKEASTSLSPPGVYEADIDRCYETPAPCTHEVKTPDHDARKACNAKTANRKVTSDIRKNYGPLEQDCDKRQTEFSFTGKARAREFQQRRSITISTDEPLLPQYETTKRQLSFPKTPNSSFLTKLKERIEQSLFLSSEWPHAAAMVHERRQRANLYVKKAFKQQNPRLEQIQLTELSKRKNNERRRKTPSPNIETDDKKETGPEKHVTTQPTGDDAHEDTLPPEAEAEYAKAAKEAFRRRSISEDIYDRLPPTYIVERHAITASASECLQSSISSRSSSGGIVCSDEDLHFILSSYKRDKSPSHRQNITRPATGIVTDSSHPHPDPVTKLSSSSRKISEIPTSDSTNPTENQPVENTKDSLFMQQNTSNTLPEERSDNDDAEILQPPEIVFDENGQTWDVYGADFDPEILGEAIQRHLQKIMSQTESKMIDTQQGGEGVTSPVLSRRSSENSATAGAWWRMFCPFLALRKESALC